MTEPTVGDLLAESFAVLAQELPPAWLRFCACLDGRAVEVEVDDERFTVRFARGAAAIDPPAPAAPMAAARRPTATS